MSNPTIQFLEILDRFDAEAALYADAILRFEELKGPFNVVREEIQKRGETLRSMRREINTLVCERGNIVDYS